MYEKPFHRLSSPLILSASSKIRLLSLLSKFVDSLMVDRIVTLKIVNPFFKGIFFIVKDTRLITF